jgi:hypothetical protein
MFFKLFILSLPLDNERGLLCVTFAHDLPLYFQFPPKACTERGGVVSVHIRAVLRVATAFGAARLHQRACSSLLPPTPLAGFNCGREAVKFKRSRSDGDFQ